MDCFQCLSYYQVLINHIIFFKILKIVDIGLNINEMFERFGLFLINIYTGKKTKDI
jgi:hypothetical protein